MAANERRQSAGGWQSRSEDGCKASLAATHKREQRSQRRPTWEKLGIAAHPK